MPGVLLFGGSFDPIHNGHITVARFVADRLAVERVVLIPAANPPHKRSKALAPAEHRLEMCRLASAGDPGFEVSDWETRQTGPNYTLLTVQHFRALWPDLPLYWLVGTDSLAELHTWFRVGELASICTIVTARRPGATARELSELSNSLSPAQMQSIRENVIETPLVNVSATEIRARVSRSESIAELVPQSVARYIRAHRLYAPDPTNPGQSADRK